MTRRHRQVAAATALPLTSAFCPLTSDLGGEGFEPPTLSV